MGTPALLVLCTPHSLEESSLVLVALLLTQEAVHPEDLTQARICGVSWFCSLGSTVLNALGALGWEPCLHQGISSCSVCSPTINTHWH